MNISAEPETTVISTTENWLTVCTQDDLVNDSGICALLPDQQQVAIFYVQSEQQLFAIGNYDPFGQANVLYRGIIGSINDELVVASPLYKQHFSLTSGACLQDETISVKVFESRIINHEVQLKVA